jgi:hypothetical protein
MVADGAAKLVGHHCNQPMQIAVGLQLHGPPQPLNPTQQDQQVVISWLKSYGLGFFGTYSNHLLVDAEGTTRQIERMLRIRINDYAYWFEGRQVLFYAPDREPTVDAQVSDIVNTIVGLDDHPHDSWPTPYIIPGHLQILGPRGRELHRVRVGGQIRLLTSFELPSTLTSAYAANAHVQFQVATACVGAIAPIDAIDYPKTWHLQPGQTLQASTLLKTRPAWKGPVQVTADVSLLQSPNGPPLSMGAEKMEGKSSRVIVVHR